MFDFNAISSLTFGEAIKGFLLIAALSAAVAYVLNYATHGGFVLPGDLYKVKAPRRIYVPFGSTLIFSMVIFIVLTSKLLSFIIMLATVYIAYRAIFKRGF